jgi:hypothetical protein
MNARNQINSPAASDNVTNSASVDDFNTSLVFVERTYIGPTPREMNTPL